MSATATEPKNKPPGVGAPTEAKNVKNEVDFTAVAEDARRFLDAVLPPDGRFCLWTKHDKAHHWFDSHEVMLDAQYGRFKDTPDVYYGTAGFGGLISDATGKTARSQANVTGRKCLHADIDCGEAKYAKKPDETYPNQQDGLRALKGALAQGLPAPTYIIDSGTGLHLYWVLTEVIDGTRWKVMAEGLKKTAEGLDLKLDDACTADSARVLRLPGSLHNCGKRVAILKNTGRTYEPQVLATRLGAVDDPALDDSLMTGAVRRATGINNDVLAYDGPPLPPLAELLGTIPADYIRGEWARVIWGARHGYGKTEETRQTLIEWCKTCPEKWSDRGQQQFDGVWNSAKRKDGATVATLIHIAKQHGWSSGMGAEGVATARQTQEITRAALKAELPDWQVKSVTGADGIVRQTKIKPLATVPNVQAISRLSGWLVRYNEMSKRVELTREGVVIPRDDQDNNALTLFGDDVLRCGIPRDGIAALVDGAAMNNRYHPALSWVVSRPWDGRARLAAFHATLELVDPRKTPLAVKLLDRWMLQCIGALVEPDGIAAAGALVLAGPQHIGKTHWAINLVRVPGTVGTGLNIDPDNKDSVLRAIRFWIAELGELGATTQRAHVEALKAFLTNSEDVVRIPYARRDTAYRRRTVFVGTVNGTGFLVDDTGNRRFWVIEVKRCHVLPADDMQQVWAEYLHRYRNGARWHLDPQTLAELNASNEQFQAVDPLREKIATGFDWSGTDWSMVDSANWRGCPDVLWLSASDLCLRVGIERPTRSEATRAGVIVREFQRVNAGGAIGGPSSISGGPSSFERLSQGARLLAIPTRRL